MENTALNFEAEIQFLEDLKNKTGAFAPRKKRGSQPELVQTGWKSDGQMAGNGGSK